jgi:hypothetical protein
MASLNSKWNYYQKLKGQDVRKQKSFSKGADAYLTRLFRNSPPAWILPAKRRPIDQAKVEREIERLQKLAPRPLYVSAPRIGGGRYANTNGPAYRTAKGQYVTTEGKSTI